MCFLSHHKSSKHQVLLQLLYVIVYDLEHEFQDSLLSQVRHELLAYIHRDWPALVKGIGHNKPGSKVGCILI